MVSVQNGKGAKRYKVQVTTSADVMCPKSIGMRQVAHGRLALGVSPQIRICYVVYSYTSVV